MPYISFNNALFGFLLLCMLFIVMEWIRRGTLGTFAIYIKQWSPSPLPLSPSKKGPTIVTSIMFQLYQKPFSRNGAFVSHRQRLSKGEKDVIVGTLNDKTTHRKKVILSKPLLCASVKIHI